MQLTKLFNPSSVAVIGATEDTTKVGYALIKNIIDGGTREVYPITLDEQTVLDHVAYMSVKAVPGPVDLAIIAVRADIVPTILEECAEKEIHTAIVITAGFKEMGEAGAKLEEEMVRVAEEHKITLLGPNCLGVIDAHADWNASFAVEKPREGGIAFVSQSGALGTAMLDWANAEGVGFSKFVSLGNKAALSELEFMEYLKDDAETKAVLLYLEQVNDGPAFLEAAKALTEKKPLVVLRAGRGERGSAAVASHTGSLAPSDKVFEAALQQVGAIPVETLDELFGLAKLFELGLTSTLQNLVVLTNGGGPSVNTADLIDFSDSLSLATFSDATKEALKAVLPPMAAVNNPIDVIGDAGPERYDNTLKTLIELDDVDAVIALVTPQMMTSPKKIADVLAEYRAQKPILPLFLGGAMMVDGVQTLRARGMVNFASPTELVNALDALARRSPKAATESAPRLLQHLRMLPYDEMQRLLEEHDIPLLGVLVTDRNDLASATHNICDAPYAIKALSPQLVHKTDMDAIMLNVPSLDALPVAWDEISNKVREHEPNAVIEGMLVQPMVDGVECIVGMKRDPVFGPVIVFGLGGIFVEILKDSSMRVAPVTEEEAMKQIQEVQGLPLLTGARGKEPADIDALARLISRLSELAIENPEILEIDCNPVFATPYGTRIVDARMMVDDSEAK